MQATALVLAISVAVLAPAIATADEAGLEWERVEAAQGSPFPLPGPIYDESGRLLAAPPPSEARSVRELLLRLPALPEAVGDTGSEPRRSAPPRRGEP